MQIMPINPGGYGYYKLPKQAKALPRKPKKKNAETNSKRTFSCSLREATEWGPHAAHRLQLLV